MQSSDVQIELSGVAALADRPVDGRRVALVMSAVAIVLAGLGALGIEHLLAGANAEPATAEALRRHAAIGSAAGPPRHVAMVLIDGMRADEAAGLEAWRSLAPASVTGTIALSTPTLSRPFYHLLFTGVPQHASGVRTNRFAGPARLDSVMNRVREAGGSVVFASEGLDWMRRMHGRRGDGGSDAPDALEARPLATHLDAWRAAPSPALLVVHFTSTDSSAHHEGVRSAAHRRALDRADRVIAQVAERAPALLVLSDHGHREAGGHGGPEPDVAIAPLLARAPGLAPAVLDEPLRATRLAPTIAAWLGVEPPRSALSHPSAALTDAPARSETALLASLAQQGRRAERLARLDRQRWLVPLALLLALLALGPIKRAYGFDRATPIALLGWPLLVLATHLALDRPLSLSAIDTRLAHGLRVALIGGLASLAVFAIARLAGRRDAVASTRRAAASVGWSAAASALFACAWAGLSLAWPLEPVELYLPLLALGAAAPALVTMAFVLLASAWITRSGARSPEAS